MIEPCLPGSHPIRAGCRPSGESLDNLTELWEQVRRSDRAAHARDVLRQRYQNSRFAQRVL